MRQGYEDTDRDIVMRWEATFCFLTNLDDSEIGQ